MNKNHISEAELVAFFDSELDRPRREFVANHVASCRMCREVLDTLTLACAAAQSLPLSYPSDMAWMNVEQGIKRQAETMIRVQSGAVPLRHKTQRNLWIAAAACLAFFLLSLTLLSGRVFNSNGTDGDVPALLAATTLFDWGLFLTDLDHPIVEPRFERSYSLTPVSLKEAEAATGFAVTTITNRFPKNATFQRARLIQLPGATAAQFDIDWGGVQVIIFYQPKDTELAFSGFIARQTTVREIPCLSVYCTNYRALAMESEDGIVTVISRRGTDLVEDVIEYFID